MTTKLSKDKKEIQGSPSIKQAQEKTRGKLAFGLFVTFSIIIILAVIYALFSNISPQGVDLIKYILSSLVGIMGVVFGFYYGQNSE